MTRKKNPCTDCTNRYVGCQYVCSSLGAYHNDKLALTVERKVEERAVRDEHVKMLRELRRIVDDAEEAVVKEKREKKQAVYDKRAAWLAAHTIGESTYGQVTTDQEKERLRQYYAKHRERILAQQSGYRRNRREQQQLFRMHDLPKEEQAV